MQLARLFLMVGVVGLAAVTARADANNAQPLSLQQATQTDDEAQATLGNGPLFMGETSPGVSAHVPPKAEEPFDNDYRQVNSFFNIREANPDVEKGQFQVEHWMKWDTKSNGRDDNFGMQQAFRYGITNSFFAEISVQEPNLGDGDRQGAGDIGIVLFNRFVKEVKGGDTPAVAGIAELRLPSGHGSRNTDIKLTGIVTKSLEWGMRAHFQGYIQSANGGYSDYVDCDRRDIQFGFGPGFDWEVDDKTLVLINYLNKSSDKNVDHNNNILELGATRQIVATERMQEHIKVAIDVGLDGQDETPNFGAKFLWSITWR